MEGRSLLAQTLVLTTLGVLLLVIPGLAEPKTGPKIGRVVSSPEYLWVEDPFVPPATTQNQAKLNAELSSISRLIIPNLNVEAPLEKKGLDKNSKMEDPSTAEVVSWYDFSPVLDSGDNIVLAGHRELKGNPAVFWDLQKLQLGDVVVLHVGESQLIYRVVSINFLGRKDAINEFIADTKKESLTLITCDGEFLYEVQDYALRRIVRAEKVNGS